MLLVVCSKGTIMGLLVNVYKNCGMERRDIPRQANYLCLVNVDGPFSPNPEAPAAMLLPDGPGRVMIMPAVLCENGEYIKDPRNCIMGGNYAAFSDSRFHEAVKAIIGGVSYGAVPICQVAARVPPLRFEAVAEDVRKVELRVFVRKCFPRLEAFTLAVCPTSNLAASNDKAIGELSDADLSFYHTLMRKMEGLDGSEVDVCDLENCASMPNAGFAWDLHGRLVILMAR
jgi:hypothetical protein